MLKFFEFLQTISLFFFFAYIMIRYLFFVYFQTFVLARKKPNDDAVIFHQDHLLSLIFGKRGDDRSIQIKKKNFWDVIWSLIDNLQENVWLRF